MYLNDEQISILMSLVSETQRDTLGCDDCLQGMTSFAESTLLDQSLSDGMQAVRDHLQQCTCCRDEYGLLLDALRAIDTA